jgi:hypothetical protein
MLADVNSPLQAQLPWQTRVSITAGAALLSSFYVHALQRRTSPGTALRLLLTLPLCALNLWLPLLFDARTELLTRVSVVFVGWLASFKVRGTRCPPSLTRAILSWLGWPSLPAALQPAGSRDAQVIALCMNRGPLQHNHTVAQTAVLYLLPVYPRQGVLLGRRRRAASPASGPLLRHRSQRYCLAPCRQQQGARPAAGHRQAAAPPPRRAAAQGGPPHG